MDLDRDEMDEADFSLGLDLSDLENNQLLDINDIFPDDILQQTAQQEFCEIISRPAPVQSPVFKSESVSSRTQLKQQLMKDQLFKERERIKARELPPTPTPRPVKVPINIQNVVPQHVLHVTTGLQNPTRYHLKEKRKNQVMEFLSSSQKEQHGTHREAYSAPVVQRSPAVIGRPTSSFTIPPPSPGMLSVASGDTSDADVIGSILSLEETNDAQRSLYGSNASLESSSRLKSEPESFEDFGRERVKKETHNMIERRRRYNINDRIKELGDLLPQKNEPHYDVVRDCRANKGTILKSSVDYIKILKEEDNKKKQIEQHNQQLQRENRKLRLWIQQLEMVAQQQGVVLEQTMWKPASAQDILTVVANNSRGRVSMPDVVTDAACAYDDTMDDVVSPDPMLTAAAALPRLLAQPASRSSPLSPMDTE